MKVTKTFIGVGAAIGFGYGFFAASQNFSYGEEQKAAMQEAGLIFANVMLQAAVVAIRTGATAFGGAVLGILVDSCLEKSGHEQKDGALMV